MPASLRTRAPFDAAAAGPALPERCTEACSDLRLVGEQRPLALEPAAVADERAVGADDAVARDDDRDRVAAVGETDRAHGARVAELVGERTVGRRLAVGDLEQQRPHALLEGRSGRAELELELRALAGEVLGELPGGPGERGRVVLPGLLDVERRHVQAGERAALA